MLRRRSIRLRIVVLVLVPVVALLGLYAEVLNLSLGSLLTLNREAGIRGLVTVPVAHVQTQLGDERTLALQFLADPDKANLQLLLMQEHRTDRTITRFGTAVRTALASRPAPNERAAFLAWQRRLGQVTRLRTAVASQGLSTLDAAGAYSDLVNEGDNVLNQAIVPVLTGPLGVQATDVLTMAKVSQAVGEESDLIRAGRIGGSFPSGTLSLISQLAVLHQEEWNQTLPDLDPVLRGYFRDLIPRPAQDTIARLETQITSGRADASAVPLATWTAAESAYQKGYLRALDKSDATLARKARAQGRDLIFNLALIAGIGLAAILLVIGIGILVGRGLIRQLGDLRLSAVKLSAEQLPGAIGRLRAGEDVDVAAEVPELTSGSDEIGQVREAFNVAARTAIVAAADEVKIRRGVNDVFRSLARRNQSLLTRQLQLLDAMERRVHDPEELADLFRVDHMTTRMRRHAEGLLIVAGGSSGRAWREPVPIVDVMRAAAAEVEDYKRIKVVSRTSAALAGHAVADIIHLLAELVENAATFSPANTPVRVEGEKVARGVVVEIEDRGLGMGEDQLALINDTLADPPLFDLSGSDQLGLFIAGQLAKRHDVRLTLRASAYGGVTAVVLIPRDLIVDFDEPDGEPVIAGIRELGGRPVPELAGTGPAVLSPGETAGFLTASPAVPAETWPASPAPAPATPMALAAGSELAPPADGSELAPPAGGAGPGLPRREPGTTGLAWQQVTGYDWSANGSPRDLPPSAQDPQGGDRQEEPQDPKPAELDGLPVRVRQANLAPQLREPAVAAAEASPLAGVPSPDAARSTMAALQLGWQRGRSVADPDEQGEPAGQDPPRRDHDEPQEVPDEGGAS
jgi:anti-sigma regulatory factor (Ser/Thr protein kinase)